LSHVNSNTKWETVYANLKRIEALSEVLWQASLYEVGNLPPETLTEVANLIQELASEARGVLEAGEAHGIKEQPEETLLPGELQ
jgi:hypothetical protein